MNAQNRARVRGLRWTLIFFGIGMVATIAVYVSLHGQQNRDRNVARNSAAISTLKLSSTLSALIARRHNGIICVLRPYFEAAVVRQLASENDVFLPESLRARQHEARVSSQITVRGLVTVPPEFDCAPLLKELRRQVHRANA